MSCEEALEQILEEMMDIRTSREEEEETECSVLTKTLNSFLENLNAEVNMDFFVSTGVAMLTPWLESVVKELQTEISEASQLLSNSHIYASTVFRSESKEKTFLPEDAVNVTKNEEDATKCWHASVTTRNAICCGIYQDKLY